MTVSMRGNNEITKLLNKWYIEIRSRRIGNAHQLKEIINYKIHNIEEDQNLLLYYSLLDFKYQFLINNNLDEIITNNKKNSTVKIELYSRPLTSGEIKLAQSIFKDTID